MRILLVNPQFPNSYWSGREALVFAGRKSLLPPLGLITVAALLPQSWEFRLIDMDIQPLTDDDLRWADVAMLTGMLVQRESLHAVLARCKMLGVRTVVGGPYATALPQDLTDADHIVVGEGELLIPQLAADLEAGFAKKRYEKDEETPRPELTISPTPRYDLLTIDAYHQMSLQSSRGCPFQCEFCDIIVMYGRRPRFKAPSQIIIELDAIRATGFKGTIFFVDDNFIGNRGQVKEILHQVIMWRIATNPPFEFYTEASIDLAKDDELMELMTDAGFIAIFTGIESTSEMALKEAKKFQNTKIDLLAQVRKIQEHGLNVWAGLILGFDDDTKHSFDQMIKFIDDAAIPYAMVGTLGALPNTPLYKRLEKEGRILELHSGDQFGLTNFKTKLPASDMIAGYRKVIEQLYSPEGFFARCRENLSRWKSVARTQRKLNWHDIASGIRAFYEQAVWADYRDEYMRFLGWVVFHHPRKFKHALAQAAAGHHYITFTRETVLPRLKQQAAMLKQVADSA